MASNEEILNSRLIGFIEPVAYTENARVTPVGFKNSNGEYEVIDKNQIQTLFYPKGKIYAPKFQFDKEGYNISPNTFIEFNVRKSFKDASFKGDDYILNYEFKIISKSFIPILTLNYPTSLEDGFITQDEIFSYLNKNELKDISGYFFLKHNNYLYGLFKYEDNSDLIRPAIGKEANVYEINTEVYKTKFFKFNKCEYYLGNTKDMPLKNIGIIDCMDDKQLADWFKKQLKICAENEKILSLKKEAFQEFTSAFSETNDRIEAIRLKRIKDKVDSLSFSFEEIKELLEIDSSLTKNLRHLLQSMKNEFYAEWTKSLQEEKKKLEKEISDLEFKKNKFSKDILKIKKDFNVISETLQKDFEEKKKNLEASISEIEKKHKTIQDNYDLLVESLTLQTRLGEKKSSQTIFPTPIHFNAEGEKFSVLEENEGYGFFSLLKENLGLEELSEEIREQLNKTSVLFTHKACFIPSVSWAYLYAKTVRNSKLYTLHVEHDWLHYKDFVNNGLIDILDSCDENKEINHILVLDSLNLTQPECGLKPLLDVIAGYSLILPIFNKTLPVNLKIFATLVPFSEENKIGLPLNKDSFMKWGQVLTPKDKINLPSNFLECDTKKGFFEPNDLVSKTSLKNNEWVNNGYFAE